MGKTAFCLAAAILWSGLLPTAGAPPAGNSVLTIDGQAFPVDLDTDTTVQLAGGRRLKVGLHHSAIATFRGNGFSFRHPGDRVPSRTDLDADTRQVAVMTALATMALVQDIRLGVRLRWSTSCCRT